jgi:hypothetical protein
MKKNNFSCFYCFLPVQEKLFFFVLDRSPIFHRASVAILYKIKNKKPLSPGFVFFNKKKFILLLLNSLICIPLVGKENFISKKVRVIKCYRICFHFGQTLVHNSNCHEKTNFIVYCNN